MLAPDAGVEVARREKIVALLPMRHHSVRVPGKNFRELGGVPLYHHIVRTLIACPSIAQIVIDTDSDVIREDAQSTFPQVKVLERPEHLRGDAVPMTEILYHDASQMPSDYYLQTHSTNPLLKAETVERALNCWRTEGHLYDSLFAVTRVQARLWDSTMRPINHNPWVLLRTQDLPPIYMENSNLYIFRADLIKLTRRRIGDRPKLFEIDPLEAIDIDDERDFAFAELLMRVKQSANR